MKKTVGALLVLASGSLLAHDPITTKVTWEREIAPIFQARCVSCHSAGGRAPMSLATYEEARPWARAIREEVLARRMPKWHAVRGYGDFRNDPSLSPFEIALVTAWADGGAPRSARSGKAADRSALRERSPFAVAAASKAGDDAVAEPATRRVTLPCRSQALPGGRLLAVMPALAAGSDLRLTLQFEDGTMEPLLAVRAFDPRFVETYRLRTAVTITSRTRLLVEPRHPSEGCEIGFALAGR